MAIRQHPLAYVAPRHERKDPDLAGGACLTIPIPNDNQRRRQLTCEAQAGEWPSASAADAVARASLDALYLGTKLTAFTGHVVDWSCRRKLSERLPAVGAGDAADHIRHSTGAALRVADELVASHQLIVANRSDSCPRFPKALHSARVGHPSGCLAIPSFIFAGARHSRAELLAAHEEPVEQATDFLCFDRAARRTCLVLDNHLA